jgi:hypothetical protein
MFDDHFPCNKEECERKHVNNWIKMFILYLPIKTDRIKFIAFLMILVKLTEPLYAIRTFKYEKLLYLPG